MRIWTLSVVSVGLIAAILLVTGASSHETSGQATNTPAALNQDTNASVTPAPADQATMAEDSAEDPALANAAG